MTNLILIQHACMIFIFVLAFILTVTHFYVRRPYKLFEQSRWILLAALLLLVAHYTLQMVFGFRAQGADVGALFNILFYAPVSFLISLSLMHFMQGGRHNSRYWRVSLICFFVVLAIIAEGYWRHGSFHIGTELYFADVVYMLGLIYLIIIPTKHLTRIRRRVEAETGNASEVFEQCMRWGTILLFAFAFTFQFAIFYTPLLAVIAPLPLLALGYYVTCFISLGFNISQVAEVIDDDDDADLTEAEGHGSAEHASASAPAISQEAMAQIKEALQRWADEGGMRDGDASIVSLSRHIGVSRQQLTAYLDRQHGCTFRIWLSNLRTEEAKRLLLENPDLSNEFVAQECGFTSSSQLYRVFRTATGCTPKEWAEKQKQIQK